MALTGSSIASTYLKLLRANTDTMGADATASYIQDSADTDSALSISTTRVGIGTATPSTALDVNGQIRAQTDLIVDKTGGDAVLRFTDSGTNVWSIRRDESSNDNLQIYNYSGQTDGDVIFDIDGGIGIGIAAPGALLHLSKDAAEAGTQIDTNSDTNSHAAYINFRKAGGTAASPTNVADGERIALIQGKGYHTDGFSSAAGLRFEVDGTPGDGDMPGRILFLTSADGAATLTERMRIDSAGDVTITGDLIMADGKGIDFSADASPAAGMTSEILDDYEEGTFTATAVCSTSGTITLSGAIDLCSYIKIGRLVTVYGEIVVGSVSSPVGGLTIEGLPFTSETSSERNKRSAASFRSSVWSSSIGSNPIGMIIGAESKIRAYRFDGTNTQADLAGYCQANTEITFSCTYEATD